MNRQVLAGIDKRGGSDSREDVLEIGEAAGYDPHVMTGFYQKALRARQRAVATLTAYGRVKLEWLNELHRSEVERGLGGCYCVRPLARGTTLVGWRQDGASSGGRRAVTALFADVAGSTELASRLDPEDVVEVVGGAVRQFCEVVESFGGMVKDLAGDGILALFGTPYAHEDDPERAVLAGLEIQRIVERHAESVARAAGVDDFGVRVGIETGLVVISPIGGGSHQETGATGDAVNVAARLQSHADVGTVLVGPETRRQLGDAVSVGPDATARAQRAERDRRGRDRARSNRSASRPGRSARGSCRMSCARLPTQSTTSQREPDARSSWSVKPGSGRAACSPRLAGRPGTRT